MTTTINTSQDSFNSMNQIRQIKAWFEAAVPAPSHRNASTQLAVHFEEVSEMLEELTKAGSTFQSTEQLSFSHDVLNYIQRQLKKQDIELDLSKVDRVALLDALCDQIVTAVGVAHMLGMNIEGALFEVAGSNNSKFSKDGSPIFDEQKKIIKGPSYYKPNLTPFAGG